MKFLPSILFGILTIRDTKKSVESIVETNSISYKDIMWVTVMVIGIGINLFYSLD